MLVTVIQHLMVIIKSIFSFFFFYNETLFWPPEQSLRSSKPKSSLRFHISPKIWDFKVSIQRNSFVSYVFFWAVWSRMLKEISEDYTHLYTQTKLTSQWKKNKAFCLFFAPLLIGFFFFSFEAKKWKKFTIFLLFISLVHFQACAKSAHLLNEASQNHERPRPAGSQMICAFSPRKN